MMEFQWLDFLGIESMLLCMNLHALIIKLWIQVGHGDLILLC